MIEDFCKFSLKKQKLFMLKAMPSLMHSAFLSQKTQLAICNSFERLAADEKMQNESDSIKQMVEAVRGKLSDK
jgi:hypothetical protein